MTHSTPAPVADIRTLIADDAYAMSFQTMGQYRSALLKALAALHPQPAPAVAVEAAKQVAELVVLAIEDAYGNTDHSVPWAFCQEATDAAYGAVMDALATKPSPPTMLNGLTEAESRWISVDLHRPMLEGVGEEDVDVWTWDGKTVREDTYGLIFEQPAGPMVGGWVCTGEGFGDDAAGNVTHWMLRMPPAPPTVGSGPATEGLAK